MILHGKTWRRRFADSHTALGPDSIFFIFSSVSSVFFVVKMVFPIEAFSDSKEIERGRGHE
jgi:hypothetical protein